MNWKTPVVVSTVVAFLIIAGLMLRASQNGVSDIGNDDKNGQLKGFSLSPRSFNSPDFTEFFEKVKQAGSIVSWAGDWGELADLEKGGPTVLVSLSRGYKLIPVVEAQFFAQSSGSLLRPLSQETRTLYINSASAFSEKHKPEYLAFGIEVNVLYEKFPGDVDAFAKLFAEVYSAVKAKSPGTKVFTIFQLEKMKGLNGGLFGGSNDPSREQWFLLEKFNKSDLVAFTTYPNLIYRTPAEMPSSYYSEISSHTSKPVAFTEIGWHSGESPRGWESSEAEQAEFLRAFFNMTESLKPEFSIWSFMYDQEVQEPFNSMGLRRADGTAKQAWNEWLSN